MVELPRKDVFEGAREVEQILAEDAARAPAAEAPAMPVAEAAVANAPKKTGRSIVKRLRGEV